MEDKSLRLSDLTPADVTRLRSKSISLKAHAAATDAQVTKVAQEYEGVFLSEMLKHMFEGVKTDDTFGGGHGEDMYRSFMTEEYGKMIVKTGGIGVADHVKAEMIRMQEATPVGSADTAGGQ